MRSAVPLAGLLSMTMISTPSSGSAARDSSVGVIHASPSCTGMTTDRNGPPACLGGMLVSQIIEQQFQDEAGQDHQHTGDYRRGGCEHCVRRLLHRAAAEDPAEGEQRVGD